MKNNRLIKTICVLFAVVFLFSTIACNKKQTSSTSESSSDSSSEVGSVESETVADSNYWLFKDGKSDFAIVYPESQASNENIILAISELQGMVLEATGFSIPTYSDAEKKDVHKIISLGKTEQAINHSTLLNDLKQADVKSEGYIIKTVKDAVYLLGNSTISIVYAVYEFLEYQFGFECYAKDEYALEHNVTNKQLKEFDLIDIPDFESRSLSNWDTLSTRLRTRVYGTEFNEVDGNLFVHNSLELLPPDKYMAEHPNWYYYYAPYNQYQICYTARGDSAELDLLAQTIFEEMKVRLIAEPEIDWISFCHEDYVAWCDCEACTKDYKTYDQVKYTASYANAIRLINKVAKRMKEWNQTECPEREIVIFLWEYDQIAYAPVKLDENKKPIKDENGNYMPYRLIKIYCTKGELVGKFEEHKFGYTVFGEETKYVDVSEEVLKDASGHMGGDCRLFADVMDFFENGQKGLGLTSISQSIQSHIMADSAENSRLQNGKQVYAEKYFNKDWKENCDDEKSIFIDRKNSYASSSYVLKNSEYYNKINKLIEDGAIGRVYVIVQILNKGYTKSSYKDSTFDYDLITVLANGNCERLSSYKFNNDEGKSIQNVIMEFDNQLVAKLTISEFSASESRITRIYGTKGLIEGSPESGKFTLKRYKINMIPEEICVENAEQYDILSNDCTVGADIKKCANISCDNNGVVVVLK